MPAKNSLRVMPPTWTNEERTEELLLILQAHPEIQEVALFTSLTHAPLTPGQVQDRAALLDPSMKRFRAIGIKAGINHLCTMGHLNENLDNALNEPWQRLVGIDGQTAAGSYCLSDADMRRYTLESYQALARTAPDFIWLDDDIRLEWHPPVKLACFCELCLTKFYEKTGGNWTREELAAAFNAGDIEDRLTLRKAWLQHTREYVCDAIELIRDAVDDVDSTIPLGFMSSALQYSGADFESWACALSGEKSLAELPAKWRPGGGYYHDDSPIALLAKINDIGAQVARLPVELNDIQYEHENFPYQRISKSSTIFVAEIAAAIGVGCTGTALNVMGLSEGTFAEFQPHFERLKECSPFFDRAVETFGRTSCEGLGFVFTPDVIATSNLVEGWSGGPIANVHELSQIGLPIAYTEAASQITLLVGDATLQWSREELLQILSGAVLMDGLALRHLTELGLGTHTGFSIDQVRETDTIERFSDDTINGKYAGWTRDARPSFWNEPTYLLSPLSAQSRAVSEIIDFKPQTLGIGGGIYENELGGRVAVMGYFPWRMLNNLAKTEQMKSLCRWLSRDSLLAYVESYARAALWCRRDAEGRAAIMVMNASLDAQPLTVAVKKTECRSTMKLIRMDGMQSDLPPCGEDEDYRYFTVENVGAWQAALLVCSQ